MLGSYSRMWNAEVVLIKRRLAVVFLTNDKSIEFVEAGVAVEAIDVEFATATETSDEPKAEA